METIEAVTSVIPHWAELILELLGALVVVATVVARMMPKSSFGDRVGKIAPVLWKVIAWLPTIGINPKTKKLEETVKEMGEKKV